MFSLLERRAWVFCIALAALLVVGVPALAAEATDTALVRKVSRRLLAVLDPVKEMEWPPTFRILDADQINAYAGVEARGEGNAPRLSPVVGVTTGMLKQMVQNDEDRLAFVIGHELGHLVLGHCTRPRPGQTEFLKQVFSREHEIAADLKGMEFALKAGYSLRGGVKGIQRMMDLGLTYSSFEGLGVGHPSWKDRLTFMDKEQASLWKAMSAFDNGTYFLLYEQYAAAERCFREVVKDFPACHEGWTNLGYAQLMQYCDALEPDDLRGFDVGQLVVGGFYRRPQSLETLVRGINEELWWEAVGALREAIRLKPDLTVAKADLGLAYLVRPAGRNVGQARRFLDEAAEQAAGDTSLHPLVRAAVYINAGVASLSAGEMKASANKFDEAEAIGRRLQGGRAKHAGSPTLTASLRYNRALMLAASAKVEDRKQAAEQFERYLQTASPSSAWWTLAYDRYAKLCSGLGQKSKPQQALAERSRTALRLVTSLTLDSGAVLALSQPLADALKHLGEGQEIPVVKNTNLVRVRFPARGLDLIASEKVLAICLHSSKSPELPLQATGLGTKAQRVRVGMSKDEIEKILENEDYDFREIDKPGHSYRFYPDVGLAVRIRQGVVEELVIVQIPRR